MAREEAVVLVPYPDGKHYSQGLGHYDPALRPDSPPITVDQAWALFAEDLVPREAIVSKMVTVPLKQHEFDALVSLYYNKGNALRPVAELINAGQPMDAMGRMLAVNRDEKGVFKPGLAARRLREMQIFLKADYGDQPQPAKPAPMLKLWRGDPKTTAFEEIPFPLDEAA